MSSVWCVEPWGGDEEGGMSVSAVTEMRNEREMFACRRSSPDELGTRLSKFGTHPAEEHGRHRPFPGSSPWWTSQQGVLCWQKNGHKRNNESGNIQNDGRMKGRERD